MTDIIDLIEKERADVEARYQLLQSYIDGSHKTGTKVKPHVRAILADARDAGYKAWRGSRLAKSNAFMLAKMVRAENGDKLYQVAIDFWDLKLEFPDFHHEVSITPWSQFHMIERHGPRARSVTVECFAAEVDTLHDLEAFFSSFYEKMGCIPYEVES